MPPRTVRLTPAVHARDTMAVVCAACHWSWLLGVASLFFAALALAKFQIVLRYFSGVQCVTVAGRGEYCASSETVSTSWGYASVTILTVPCAIGLVTGLLPVFFAMVRTPPQHRRGRTQMLAPKPAHAARALMRRGALRVGCRCCLARVPSVVTPCKTTSRSRATSRTRARN